MRMMIRLFALCMQLSRTNGVGVQRCKEYCRAEVKCQSISFNMAKLSCSIFYDKFKFFKKDEDFYFEIEKPKSNSTKASPRTVCLTTKTKGYQCVEERKPLNMIVMSRTEWYHYSEQTGVWSKIFYPRPQHIAIDDNLKRIFWVISREVQCVEVAALSNMEESTELYCINAKSKASLGTINGLVRDPIRKLIFFTVNFGKMKCVEIFKMDENQAEPVMLSRHKFQTEDLLIDPTKGCLYTYLLYKPGRVMKISYTETDQAKEIKVIQSLRTFPSIVDSIRDVLLYVEMLGGTFSVLKMYNFTEDLTNSVRLTPPAPTQSVIGITDVVIVIFGKGGGNILNRNYKQVALIPDWTSTDMPTQIEVYTLYNL